MGGRRGSKEGPCFVSSLFMSKGLLRHPDFLPQTQICFLHKREGNEVTMPLGGVKLRLPLFNMDDMCNCH